MSSTLSIILNQYDTGWQYIIVGYNGGTLQTSEAKYDSAAIALSYAQMWLDRSEEDV